MLQFRMVITRLGMLFIIFIAKSLTMLLILNMK